jgi:hypothetical protein
MAPRFEGNLGGAATGDIVDDKAHKVVVAVSDLDFFDRRRGGRAFAGDLRCFTPS